MSKKEREICEFEMDLNNFLFALQRLRNDNIISALRPGLKTGVEKSFFWSEIGSGFEEQGGTPPLRIPRSNPPPPGIRAGGQRNSPALSRELSTYFSLEITPV